MSCSFVLDLQSVKLVSGWL